MPETIDLATIERQSVVNAPTVDPKTGAVDPSFWSSWEYQRGAILSPFGSRRRMYELRWYDRNEFNTLWQGARSGLIKKIKATSYELKGGRNLTNRFDGILRNAQRGAGWGVFLSLFLRDYLRYDNGAWAEITAPGNPLKAPTGAVTGINHLDSFRCVPTGDATYPVVYYNARPGEKPLINVLHYTRVLHLIDTPDGDQDHPGYGESSLSRAIAVVQRQLLINQYTVGKLDDKPSPGLMIGNNISREDMNKAFAIYRGEQSNDLQPDWGKVAWVFNLNPAIQASITPVTFSTAPEKYDYPVYVDVDVNELALAIGVDKQELWELTGARGSAQQSIVQSEKSEGKAPGEIRASLEREINNKLLPDSLEFQWKVKDGRAAQEEATTAQIWAGVATTLAPLIGNKLAAEILAHQVEAVADALFDEDGRMIRLPDQDVKPADEATPEISTQDAAPNAPNAPAPASGAQVTAQDSTPNATKGLETEGQRRWFFAHLEGSSGGNNPLVPVYDSEGNVIERIHLQDAERRRREADVTHQFSGHITRPSDLADAARVRKATTYELEGWHRIYSTPGNSDVTKKLNGQILRTVGAELKLRGVNLSTKDIQSTRLDFEGDFADLLTSARDGDTNRRRFGIILRDLVRKYGKSAYEDGLKDGGISDGVMDEEDNTAYAVELAKQSAFVTSLGDAVYQQGISDAQAAMKASMWFNGSIAPFYDDGRGSADRNGYYTFHIGSAEKHCKDCPRLDGQTHRFKDWQRKNLLPGHVGQSTECGGYQCLCKVTKAEPGITATGNW